MLRLFFVIWAVARASDWPGFRGDNLSGHADGGAPTTWDATAGLNVAWRATIPGLAHSSPIVFGKKVFVTTAISSDPKPFRRDTAAPSDDVASHTWKIYCLDRETGKILWERVAHQGPPRTRRNPKSSQATATPTTDGKRVIAMLGSEGLFAYDLDGKLLWKQDLGVLSTGSNNGPAGKDGWEWGPGSSPILYKNLVIVQCDTRKESFLAAFESASGKPVWRTVRPEMSSWSTPLIYRGKDRDELITSGPRATRAYDPKTGEELWRMPARNLDVSAPSPVAGKELILVGNGFSSAPMTAIRPGSDGEFTFESGEKVNEHVAWSQPRGGPTMSTPIVVGDLVYVASSNGILSCYQMGTGERVYQSRLSTDRADISASPVYADGKLYFASEDGDVFVVKAGPKFELLATNPMGEVMMATPAIADGTIFIRGEHTLFAIREKK